MWWSRLLVLAAAMLIAACGFQPLYGGGKKGVVVSEMNAVRIEPIADRTGQELHNHLLDLLNPTGRPAHPKYLLKITLSESITNLAVRKSEIATRANLRITANYILSRADDHQTLTTGNSSVVGGYDILSSSFSRLVSEDDARARVVRELAGEIQTRLAAYFRLHERADASVRPAP